MLWGLTDSASFVVHMLDNAGKNPLPCTSFNLFTTEFSNGQYAALNEILCGYVQLPRLISLTSLVRII